MSQALHPLYGSSIDDFRIARAINLPPGVYEGMEPSISGDGGVAGWTASLGADIVHGRSLWRTTGNVPYGRYVVEETEAVQVAIEGPDATNPRIDLIVGVHRWIQGPIDPVSLLPTGEYSDSQKPSYVVLKGTPSASPAVPAVADPYDANGSRAVVLAQVYVPTSGDPTISRYTPTDLRLPYMRVITEEVVSSRGGFPNLKGRLDAMPTVDTYRDPNNGATNAWGGAYNNSDTFTNMTGFAMLNANIGLAMAWGVSERFVNTTYTLNRVFDVKLNCRFSQVFNSTPTLLNESYGVVGATPLWPLPASYKNNLPGADIYDDDWSMEIIGLKLSDTNNDGLTSLMAFVNGAGNPGTMEYARVQCLAIGILDPTFLAGLTSEGRHLKITS